MPKRSTSSIKITGRWNEDDARTVLDAQERSGLAISEFSAREGLDAQRLTRWQRRLSGNADGRPTFIEIGADVSATIEVVLGAGLVLRVRESIAPRVLRDLVRALGEGSC